MMHRPSSNSRPVPLTELKAHKPLSHVHAHICSCTQTYMLTQICRYMRERVVDGCVCGCVEVDREFFIFWHLIFSTHTHAARSTQSTATHTLVHTGNNTYAHTTVYICMFICTSMHVCVCAKDNETLTHSHSLSHTHTIKVCTTTWYCYLSQWPLLTLTFSLLRMRWHTSSRVLKTKMSAARKSETVLQHVSRFH